LTIGVFAAIAYVTQHQNLQVRLDASLEAEAHRFTENASEFVERATGRPRAVVFPNPRGFATPDLLVQISGADGETLARSRNLDDTEIPKGPSILARVQRQEEWFSDVDVEGQDFRVFTAPLVGSGGLVGFIQVARPLSPIYQSLVTLQTTFFSVGLAAVLFSLILGWMLARAALSPIDHLAAVAMAIGKSRDFSARVPTGRRRDEVGRLAEEFNRMLDQLHDAYEQLEATLAAQRRFVADASHELRTPLTSVRGNVELLRRAIALRPEAEGAEEIEQILADMAAETERVTRLVGDLLLLARVDAGQHLALGPLELGPVVQEAYRSARFLREGVQLYLGDLAPNVWVEGDTDRLKQLMLILLDNALKYTPDGGTVAIRSVRISRDGVPGVAFQVEDTGPGVPAEERERIFERFYRSDTVRGRGGAGLGLAIARWITDEHHGRIEVESAAGRGSTFTVWLPTVPALAAPARTPVVSALASSPAAG
jgi:signal transduction histidine kinase